MGTSFKQKWQGAEGLWLENGLPEQMKVIIDCARTVEERSRDKWYQVKIFSRKRSVYKTFVRWVAFMKALSTRLRKDNYFASLRAGLRRSNGSWLATHLQCCEKRESADCF